MKKTVAIAPIAALLLFSATVRAEPAEQLLQRAITAFGMGQLEQSMEQLSIARHATQDARLLARIQLYIGLNHAVGGSIAKARAAWSRALGHDPTLELDRLDFKRNLVDLFRAVRDGTTAPLTVTSNHLRALVFIDGKLVGSTPLKRRVLAGRHRLRVLSSDGDAVFHRDLTITAGSTPTIEARLQPRAGELSVRSSPSGAAVWVDGKRIGATPLLRHDVSVGDHRVELRHRGFAPRRRRIHVAHGTHSVLQFELAGSSTSGKSGGFVAFLARHPWTWVTAGFGLAALGAGIGLELAADGKHDDWLARCVDGDGSGSQACDDLGSSVGRFDVAANVMFGVAGAAAVGAVLLLIFEGGAHGEKADKRAHAESAGASVRVVPSIGSTNGATLHLRF